MTGMRIDDLQKRMKAAGLVVPDFLYKDIHVWSRKK
jgi:hypothetical protein